LKILKGGIRSRKSIEKRIMSKEQAIIYKTPHRKPKTEKY
jgi:hypothetical protein